MKEMKWVLFNLQFWSFLLDLNYQLILVPFNYCPLTAYSYIGLLKNFGVPSNIRYYYEQVVGGCIVMSIFILFENRHNSIVPFTSVFRIENRIIRLILTLLNFFPGCPGFLLAIFQRTSVDDVKMEMLEVVPCPDKLFFDRDTFAVEQASNYISYIVTTTTFLALLEIIFFFCHSVYHVRKLETAHKSTQYQKMQKTFFISSCIQAIVPIGSLVLLGFYLSYSMINLYYKQDLTNFVILMASSHGTFSTFALVLVNKPYRDFACRLLRIRNAASSCNKVVVSSASFPSHLSTRRESNLLTARKGSNAISDRI